VHYLFGPWIGRSGWVGAAAAFAGGAGAVALAAIVMAASLVFTDEQFLAVAATAVLVHLPVMLIEGVITLFCVGFLKKVKPEMLPFGLAADSATKRTA
jgi:cobalt/nickel transport system permease protein